MADMTDQMREALEAERAELVALEPMAEDVAIENIVEDFELGETEIREFVSDAKRFGMLDDTIERRIRLAAADYIEIGCPDRSTRYRMNWEGIITDWYSTRTAAYEAFADRHPTVARITAASMGDKR